MLGYIEKVHEQGGRGRNLWRDAEHMEVEDGNASDEGESDLDEVEGVDDDKKQDLHAMIKVILERLKPYFERGFLWDQRCSLASEGAMFSSKVEKPNGQAVRRGRMAASGSCTSRRHAKNITPTSAT